MDQIKKLISHDLENLEFKEKVEYINSIREFIHEHSPFKNEPVDFVKWEFNENVVANDYNPNKVAPPEMELLEVSIMNDGYTQPIVTWRNDDKQKTEVIDGFHRNRVGKESKVVAQRIKGYLPVVNIRTSQSGKNDRIASTIRHNRARGKHQVDAMSEIVIELKNRNWTNKRIASQLGMDEEEVLRLCQVSGIEHLFSDNDFSNAWEAGDSNDEFQMLTDSLDSETMDKFRIPNEKDETRIYHTYHNWECHKAGFYKTNVEGMNNEECEMKYVDILGDLDLFASILEKIIVEWKHSCEHYLTNRSMNRIAWLGQAAVCYHAGIPSKYSPGWFRLSEYKRNEADKVALKYLNIWLKNNGIDEVEIEEAKSIGRQIELY